MEKHTPCKILLNRRLNNRPNNRRLNRLKKSHTGVTMVFHNKQKDRIIVTLGRDRL